MHNTVTVSQFSSSSAREWQKAINFYHKRWTHRWSSSFALFFLQFFVRENWKLSLITWKWYAIEVKLWAALRDLRCCEKIHVTQSFHIAVFYFCCWWRYLKENIIFCKWCMMKMTKSVGIYFENLSLRNFIDKQERKI